MVNTAVKTAYLFPGQGAQSIGMGKSANDASSEAAAVFAEADKALGFSISRLCFEGPEDALTQTVNTQPAILTVSVALLVATRNVLEKKGYTASYTAGHSLGEYSALVAAGSLSFYDAVRLVRERGRLMQEAGNRSPGAMAAVMGIEESALAAVCKETGAEMANLNAPDQIVISGSREAVDKAQELAKSRGAKRVIPLKVSAAFHSALMEPAVLGMRAALQTVQVSKARVPIVSNVTAGPIEEPEAIRAELSLQIRSAVQWTRTVEFLKAHGVSRYIEIGPGKTLTAFVKRIHPEAETLNIASYSDMQALAGA